MSSNYFGALANVDFDAPEASAPAPKKEAKSQTTTATTTAPSQPAAKQQGGKQPTPSAQALKQGGAAQPKGSPQPSRAVGQAGGQQGQGQAQGQGQSERGGRGGRGRGGRGRGNGEGFRGERRNYNQEGGFNQEGGDNRRNYNRPPRQQGQGQGQGNQGFSVEGAPQEGGSVRRGRGGYKNRGTRPENPQQNKEAQFATGSDRVYDRRPGTGRPVHEQHKGGAGRRNWGDPLNAQDDVIASRGLLSEGTVEANIEKAASESDLAGPVGADGAVEAAPKEPEGMSYKEFLAQKSKASIPSERKVEGAEDDKKAAAPATTTAATTATPAKAAAPAAKGATKGKKTGSVPLEQFFDVKVDVPSPDGERRRDRGEGGRGGYGRGRGGRGGRGGRKQQYSGSETNLTNETDFPSLNPASPSQPRPKQQTSAPAQQPQQQAATQATQQPAAQQPQAAQGAAK